MTRTIAETAVLIGQSENAVRRLAAEGTLHPETDPSTEDSWDDVLISDESIALYLFLYRRRPENLVALLKSYADA